MWFHCHCKPRRGGIEFIGSLGDLNGKCAGIGFFKGQNGLADGAGKIFSNDGIGWGRKGGVAFGMSGIGFAHDGPVIEPVNGFEVINATVCTIGLKMEKPSLT